MPFFLIVQSCTQSDRTIKIKGSDTEVNLAVNLAERFDNRDHRFSIAISGGGSGMGITSLMNGQADIANSSRPLTDEEKQMFKEKNIELRTVVFAEDATAFVVNKENPINEIDVQTLGKIMDGKISDWKSVSGLNLPINIYGRQSSSGTYSFIKKKLKIDYSPKAKEMTGNAQILEGVKIDKSGIGYVGAGYISKKINENKGIKVLKIRETPNSVTVSPLDPISIKNREYFFQRPLYQFIPEKAWEKVKPFIEYETKGEGRLIIENSGYYLIN
ncbi:PstS family phosphate ABC transporter substrate-binding protein [Chryseobacterium oryctis]|uniref:PstS family phosphate ABC transporter substrate-binding protein n=1 Tax=Chryseobacterium oryctis TaxID=2952618 RepID=A0ABT3HP72_9FLAO|nr:PstS family phosphate ABC transporter substrate-binding protein [Chryseobacterium oryctis]MCW3161587.1 PstS family phosphate ABC transporter substrate-binding protein [Chryseobacterium oryctis]